MKGKLLQSLLDKGGEHAAQAIMAFGGIEILAGILRKLDLISRQDSKMLGGLAFLLTGYMIERGRKKSEANKKQIEITENRVDNIIPDAERAARLTAATTAAKIVRETLPAGVPVYRDEKQ